MNTRTKPVISILLICLSVGACSPSSVREMGSSSSQSHASFDPGPSGFGGESHFQTKGEVFSVPEAPKTIPSRMVSDLYSFEDGGKTRYALATRAGVVLTSAPAFEPEQIITTPVLPSNDVRTIKKAGKNRILVGTEAGVAIINFRGETVVSSAELGSLAHAQILAAHWAAGKGELYVAADGLFVSKDGGSSFKRIDSIENITSITTLRSSVYYVADSNINRIGGQGAEANLTTQHRAKYRQIAAHRGYIYAATERTIDRLDPNSLEVVRTIAVQAGGGQITCLKSFVDKLVIGRRNGISTLEGNETANLSPGYDKWVTNIVPFGNGGYLASSLAGLNSIEEGVVTSYIKEKNFPESYVSQIVSLEDGSVLSVANGTVLATGRKLQGWSNLTRRGDYLDKQIAVHDQTILMATRNSIRARVPGWSGFKKVSNLQAHHVAVSPDGRFYVTSGQFVYASDDNLNFTPIASRTSLGWVAPKYVAPLSNDMVVVAGNGKAVLLEGTSVRHIDVSPISRSIKGAKVVEGRVFIWSRYHVVEVNLETLESEAVFLLPQEVRTGRAKITDFHISRDGQFAAVATNKGVFLSRGGEAFKHISVGDGLPTEGALSVSFIENYVGRNGRVFSILLIGTPLTMVGVVL